MIIQLQLQHTPDELYVLTQRSAFIMSLELLKDEYESYIKAQELLGVRQTLTLLKINQQIELDKYKDLVGKTFLRTKCKRKNIEPEKGTIKAIIHFERESILTIFQPENSTMEHFVLLSELEDVI